MNIDFKQELRNKIYAYLKLVDSNVFHIAGKEIAERFIRSQSSRELTIGIFKNFDREIDTSIFINYFKKILFPHSYRSPEEYAADILKFDTKYVFVPALAFDNFGNRLGRGRGYYDRCISVMKQSQNCPCIIGLGLSFQIFDAIPNKPHDQKVDLIMTPNTDIRPEYVYKY